MGFASSQSDRAAPSLLRGLSIAERRVEPRHGAGGAEVAIGMDGEAAGDLLRIVDAAAVEQEPHVTRCGAYGFVGPVRSHGAVERRSVLAIGRDFLALRRGNFGRGEIERIGAIGVLRLETGFAQPLDHMLGDGEALRAQRSVDKHQRRVREARVAARIGRTAHAVEHRIGLIGCLGGAAALGEDLETQHRELGRAVRCGSIETFKQPLGFVEMAGRHQRQRARITDRAHRADIRHMRGELPGIGAARESAAVIEEHALCIRLRRARRSEMILYAETREHRCCTVERRDRIGEPAVAHIGEALVDVDAGLARQVSRAPPFEPREAKTCHRLVDAAEIIVDHRAQHVDAAEQHRLTLVREHGERVAAVAFGALEIVAPVCDRAQTIERAAVHGR